MRQRSHDVLADGRPRCVAVVPKRLGGDSHRCTNPTKEGGLRCIAHERERKRLDYPHRYVIAMQFKPKRINEDGSYRSTIYGKTFTHRESAESFMYLNWNLLTRDRHPGERFLSACVEPLSRFTRKQGKTLK